MTKTKVISLGAVLLLGAVSWLALRAARRHPYLPVGWFWYVGTLLPVLGLVQVGSQPWADRYTYIPYIGLCIAIVCLVPFNWLNALIEERQREFQDAGTAAELLGVSEPERAEPARR